MNICNIQSQSVGSKPEIKKKNRLSNIFCDTKIPKFSLIHIVAIQF
jgi:hypothetical protein